MKLDAQIKFTLIGIKVTYTTSVCTLIILQNITDYIEDEGHIETLLLYHSIMKLSRYCSSNWCSDTDVIIINITCS